MPIFGGIGQAALEFLLAQAVPADRAAGAHFFREGDSPTGMFVIETGRVRIERTRQGRQYVLAELGSGDCFGEMALMDLHPRSACALALSDCHAIEIRPGDLFALYERDCTQFALIQMNIGREVCRRLRVADDLVFAMQPPAAAPLAEPTPRPPSGAT